MKSTCPAFADYLGVDLTDGIRPAPRPIDVCGLARPKGPGPARFRAAFWQWTYDGGGTRDASALLPELRAARGAALDGPHALAAPGESVRQAERLLRAPGRTPDSLERITGPYAGFVRTSVELFAALDAAGIAVGTGEPATIAGRPEALEMPSPGAVAEFYPGVIWNRLVPRLPRKSLAAGLAARRSILEALGLAFPPGRLTHDQLDAALGALLVAAWDGQVPGLAVERVGPPLVREGAILREGGILVLAADRATAARLSQAARID